MDPCMLVFCEDHPQPEPGRYLAAYPQCIGPTISEVLRSTASR